MNGNTLAMIRAIRRHRGQYLLHGESEAGITAKWWRFRAENTRRQRYLWLVAYPRMSAA